MISSFSKRRTEFFHSASFIIANTVIMNVIGLWKQLGIFFFFNLDASKDNPSPPSPQPDMVCWRSNFWCPKSQGHGVFLLQLQGFPQYSEEELHPHPTPQKTKLWGQNPVPFISAMVYRESLVFLYISWRLDFSCEIIVLSPRHLSSDTDMRIVHSSWKFTKIICTVACA